MRRVLIDGSMAKGGGGFTYLVNILPWLRQIAPDDRYRVLVRSPGLAASIASTPNLEVDLLPDVGWRERLAFTQLEAPRVAKAWDADVYFSAGECAPLRAPCPVIASFRNPHVFTAIGLPWKQRLRLRVLKGLAQVSAWTCDRIMFVSEDSARWIGDSIRLPERRRAVIHHGIDLERWQRSPAPSQSHPLGGRPFILSVSSVYRHKNYVRLIEAYAALGRRRIALPDLVIIGDDQDPAYWQLMQEARSATGPLASRIHILGEVPYAEIKAYYAAASLFVFPSYLETFGHPLVEAMASGAAIAAGDIPTSRELCGEAARYFDPHDTGAVAEALLTLWRDGELRAALGARGRARSRDFSWEKTAQETEAVLAEALAAP